jgi:hypothetical protein
MIGAVMELRRQGSSNGNGKHLPMAPADPNARTENPFCHACWSGEYPIPFTQHPRTRQMRLLDL